MRRKQLWFISALAVCLLPGFARAQASGLDLGGHLEVGGEGERYVRALQVAGLVPLTGWTIQPFAPTTDSLLTPRAAHPWQSRFAQRVSPSHLHVLRPSAQVVGNSAYPFQVGNGPTWDGRGLTGEIQAGVAADWGILHAQLAPLAFVAQNASFEVAPNGLTGTASLRDPRFPETIDAPQRFGTGTYSRVVAGTSYLTLDAFGFSTGFSTAPQHWGPSREYPLVLGPNAGGFPNVFFGSSRPLNIWFAHVQGRLEYGELGQSSLSPQDTGNGRRLGSGLVGSLTPRGIPGLEIGGGRFFHRPWTGMPSLAALARPFSGIVTVSNPGVKPGGINVADENQVASLFARWALPSAKSEFYGEYYKEDYPGKFHAGAGSVIEAPDDYAAYTLGFQRALTADSTHIRMLRGEVVNAETSHISRGQRGFTHPFPLYLHTPVVQGHTEDGLILGSPEAYGGAAWRVGIDDFTPAGRRSISLERQLRMDWLPTDTTTSVHPDVIYGVRLEAMRFRGKQDYGVVLIPAVDLNRNLVAHHDVLNLTVAVSAHGWP